MKLLNYIFISILLLGYNNTGLCQNLVPNPSFEQYSSCPTQSSELYLVNDWSDANLGTTDYFNSCYTTGGVNVGVPSNWMGNESANTGNAFVGIMLFENSSSINDYREYIQAQLNTSLLTGVKYYVSFYISLADSACYSTDDIGVYFSTSEINQGDFFNINMSPQVHNLEDSILDNSYNWRRIIGSFIANGGEDFIVIGNFKDDINTDVTAICATSNLDYMSAYYYIDDICVSSDSLSCVNSVGIDDSFSIKDRYRIITKKGKLTLTSIISSTFSVSLFDTAGKLVYSSSNNQNTCQFDTSFLNSSIYFLHITDNTGFYTQKIFIHP